MRGAGVGRIADGSATWPCDIPAHRSSWPTAVSPIRAPVATRLADHPAAFFDTSVFGPLDLLELFARVPVERIVFGSDPPYGQAVPRALRHACGAQLAAGLTDAELRAVLGGNMRSVLAAMDPATPPRPGVRGR